jgi:hypothetical protein
MSQVARAAVFRICRDVRSARLPGSLGRAVQRGRYFGRYFVEFFHRPGPGGGSRTAAQQRVDRSGPGFRAGLRRYTPQRQVPDRARQPNASQLSTSRRRRPRMQPPVDVAAALVAMTGQTPPTGQPARVPNVVTQTRFSTAGGSHRNYRHPCWGPRRVDQRHHAGILERPPPAVPSVARLSRHGRLRKRVSGEMLAVSVA